MYKQSKKDFNYSIDALISRAEKDDNIKHLLKAAQLLEEREGKAKDLLSVVIWSSAKIILDSNVNSSFLSRGVTKDDIENGISLLSHENLSHIQEKRVLFSYYLIKGSNRLIYKDKQDFFDKKLQIIKEALANCEDVDNYTLLLAHLLDTGFKGYNSYLGDRILLETQNKWVHNAESITPKDLEEFKKDICLLAFEFCNPKDVLLKLISNHNLDISYYNSPANEIKRVFNISPDTLNDDNKFKTVKIIFENSSLALDNSLMENESVRKFIDNNEQLKDVILERRAYLSAQQIKQEINNTNSKRSKIKKM